MTRTKTSKIRGLLKRAVWAKAGSSRIELDHDQVEARLIRDFLASRRRKIVRTFKGAGGNPYHNAKIKRLANTKARKLRKWLAVGERALRLNRTMLTRSVVQSPLLDRLVPDRPTTWRKIISRRYTADPKRVEFRDFNFIDHPSAAMRNLKALANAECTEYNAYLDFCDGHCDDIGAYLVIAEIWPQLGPIFRGGRISHSTRKVLGAVGLDSELNIRLTGRTDEGGIWPFKIRRRRPRNTTQSPIALLKPQTREHLNDELIETINSWLEMACGSPPDMVAFGDNGDELWELSDEGKANLANMVNEILDNAERHSWPGSSDGDWSMAAFMERRSDGTASDGMKCFMAFLSVGRSIAENIEHAASAVRDFCGAYARDHRSAPQSRETLITIAALQDGVTSNHSAYDDHRGGTGLLDMLSFVGDLSGHPSPGADAKVTIVSGRSCIRLCAPNLVSVNPKTGKREQWCNDANDRHSPPNPAVAFDLSGFFAGTLVSVAFTLNPQLFAPEGDDNGKHDD